MKKARKFFFTLLLLVGFIPVVFLGIYLYFECYAWGKLNRQEDNIQSSQVGIVLGCTPFVNRGQANPFFTHRIQAAYELYKEGKVQYLLLSGDNRTRYYNEPAAMRDALIRKGVPENRLVLDYAGLRTLDSVARANLVWGLEEAIVISQRFHNVRAITIGESFGIRLEGYCAKEVDFIFGIKTYIREILARCMAFADIYILSTQPKHPGPREVIFDEIETRL